MLDATDTRVEALRMATLFFQEETVPDLSKFWSIAAFCEKFILTGGDGTRAEYAPAPVQALRMVPKGVV